MKDLKRLLRHLKPYKGYVALNILCNMLMAVFTVVSIPVFIPFFRILFDLENPATEYPQHIRSLNELLQAANFQFSYLIDTYGQSKTLLLTCGIIVVLFFFKNLFRYLALYFMAPVRNGVVRDLRQSVYNHMTLLPIAYFTEERKGDMMSRIISDVQEVEVSILNVLEAVFRSPITIIGAVFIMVYLSPGLTLIVFALMLFTGVVIGGVSRQLRRRSGQLQDLLGSLVSTVEETIGGLRVVKAFRAEHFKQQHFKEVNDAYRSLQTRIIRRRDLSSPLSEFLGITVVAALLWIGAQRIFMGEMGAETFMAFLLAFYNVIDPTKQLTNAWYNIQKGMAAVDRFDKVLHAPQGMPELPNPASLQGFRDGIRFEQVWFRYPNAEKWALQGIDLAIPKGHTIALVGLSGAGKSTIADLIPRFYDVTKGRITLDGMDIRDLRVCDLRGLMGIVTQDAVLFHDTIARNIAFGLDVPEETIRDAAEKAYAMEFIEQLPDGLHFNIGDGGNKLSGGQKQRITIARAILRDPQILILDEATSALDSESERLVQRALDALLQNRTALVIAHRLSTIRRADNIIVLRDGCIVETGVHDALRQRNGEYNRLVELQGLHD